MLIHSKKLLAKFAIIFGIILFIFLFILYLFPQKLDVTAVAVSTSDSNDTVRVSLSLTKRRYFFKPTQITGYILFDGVEYESVSTMKRGYDIYVSNSFWENIKLKFQNFSYDIFARTDMRDKPAELLKDTITIHALTKTEILIYKSDDSRDGTIVYNITLPA